MGSVARSCKTGSGEEGGALRPEAAVRYLGAAATYRVSVAPRIHLAVLSVVLSTHVVAQSGDDLRDRVVTKAGIEHRGRVWSRFSPDEIVVVRGGHRERIARAEVREVHTVGDDLREFFRMRAALRGNKKRAWYLVEWAASRKLPGMARLQALSIVFDDPDHAAAQRFLGNKPGPAKAGKPTGWRWSVAGRPVSFAEFERHHGKWGRELALTGEHFTVRTDAGIRRAVATLFDLERLYLFWEDTFGEGVRMREALAPMPVYVWRSLLQFPALTSKRLPYYDLQRDVAMTYYRPDGKRPEQLFGVAAQAMIYHTFGDVRPQPNPRHACAWAEIGIAQWVEDAFDGPPGEAQPLSEARLSGPAAGAVLAAQPRLKFVVHWHYELFHELSRRVGLRWDTTRALVHFLMSQKPEPKLRPRFMALLVAAFQQGQGDSSSTFDRVMGMKAEQLEVRFRKWLRR
ncbi:MAG: hypothetical protein KDC87_16250 [Planctomycetes bacterium]|nr:hypothetical protein [Planctomycetota bacterium]MCB9868435.1 hypothetical protein [Planctomycetota bacterium]